MNVVIRAKGLRESQKVKMSLMFTPQARIDPKKCIYCGVRHLCDEYWQWHARQCGANQFSNSQVADLQIKLTNKHGPSSWDGAVESPSNLKTDGQFLLRTGAGSLQFSLYPGQRLRLLNAYLNNRKEELGEDESPPVVATIGANTEAFPVQS